MSANGKLIKLCFNNLSALIKFIKYLNIHKMSNIIRCDDVDINKINYTKPEKNGQSYFSSISYGDTLKPLYIQTPKLISKSNISDMKNKKIPYLDVEVPHGKMNIYDCLLSLDDNNIKETFKKNKEWFGKDIPLEVIDDMYRRTTKPFKKNTCPTLRLRLPVIKNEIKCGVYNQKRIFIGTDQVKDNVEVVLILHVRGLKILKSSYYCDCYITQIKVFQDTETKFNIIKDYSIIDEDDDDISDVEDIFSEEIYGSSINKQEKEAQEKEAQEKEAQEKETQEKEAQEKETHEKEAQEKEEMDKIRREIDIRMKALLKLEGKINN